MEFFRIGQITTTHGIKGEVRVQTESEDLEKYFSLEKVYIGDEKLKLHIENIRRHKNFLLIEFKEYNNINEVLKFKDKIVYIEEEDLEELAEGEYYIYDLMESKVYDMDDNYIGVIEEIMQSPAHDIYVIRNEGKEYLVPGVKEFIKKIDIDNKKMIIDPIDGMID